MSGSELVFSVRRLAPDGLEAAWQQVVERGYEGYVAKDEASAYDVGATARWLKVKQPDWAVAGGGWRRRVATRGWRAPGRCGRLPAVSLLTELDAFFTPTTTTAATSRPASSGPSCGSRGYAGPAWLGGRTSATRLPPTIDPPYRPGMDRRRFLLTSLAGAVAAPLAVEAQPPKRARIAILSTGNPRSAAIFQAFEQRLRELGYIEGQNLVIEFRNAEGRTERLPSIAAEFVRLNVDLVVVATDPATRAVKEASAKLPIVMVSVNYDPVKLGYVSSLARPGTNVTGVLFLHRELTGKRLELLREMLPGVKRVAVLSDPLAAEQVNAVEVANRAMGLTLQLLELRNPLYDFEGAFRDALSTRAEALLVLTTPVIFRERSKVAQLAVKNRLPTSFAHREHVEAGGLMSYGPNFPDMWRLAAAYADKILKGAKPGDLPMEQPTNFELVINLRTAKALGLTIPPSLLARADQIIE